MKKAIFPALLLVFFAGLTFSAPRDEIMVKKTYLNEGNFRVPFAVTLTSSTWTEILPVDAERRNAIIQTLSSETYFVCTSTTSASASSCSTSRQGIKIEGGGVLMDNSEAVLYGRVQESGGDIVVYGEYLYDTGD